MATNAGNIPAENANRQNQNPPPPDEPVFGGEDDQNQQPSSQETTSGQEPRGGDQGTPPEGAQGPFSFQHETLRNRAPEDVERYVVLLENAVREQGQALNRQAAPPAAAPSPSPPQGQGQELSNDVYWSDPIGTMRSLVSEALEPFKQDLMQSRTLSARGALRQEFPDFQNYEPIIDSQLQAQGITDGGNPNLLRFMYFAIKGQEAVAKPGQGQSPLQNTNPQPQNAMTQANQRQSQSPPPQHRPSNSPLPPSQQAAPQRRQLTESERRIAREGGMTDEQYLEWLNVKDDEVVESMIGIPQSQQGGQ